MICKKAGSNWIIRIDKGEEVVSTLKEICEKNNIKSGFVSAIGAADKIKLGVFNTHTKEYHSKTLTGDHEITNLTGNVSRKDGEVYLHLHITVCDEECKAQGGHLNEAWISGTCEMLLTEVSGEIGRKFDENCGLNIFDL